MAPAVGGVLTVEPAGNCAALRVIMVIGASASGEQAKTSPSGSSGGAHWRKTSSDLLAVIDMTHSRNITFL